MAEDIITEIHIKVFDTTAHHHVDFNEREMDMITVLAKHKQNELQKYLYQRNANL